MARMPIDVKLARMLVAAHAHGCLRDMLATARFLGIQDPRERPADQRAAADQAHAQFADPRSEFVGIVRLGNACDEAHGEFTQSQLRKLAAKHFLGFLRLREWRELHRQLRLVVRELGWEVEEERERGTGNGEQDSTAGDSEKVLRRKYVALHRALIAGLPTQVGNRLQGDKAKKAPALYDGPRGRKFQLFPGSNLAKKLQPWVLR